MTERPILFSAPMVRALLDGSKTQTRRVVTWRGVEPGLNLQFSGLSVERSGSNWVLTSPTRTSMEYRSVPMPCPYGQPGDRLWVREAFGHGAFLADGRFLYAYRAGAENPSAPPNDKGGRWYPSIHMPRAASRILLEVTDVRVERLQEISDVDTIAEGTPGGHGAIPHYAYSATPREHYRWLWESINGPGSWEANPWVWAVSFRRITP